MSTNDLGGRSSPPARLVHSKTPSAAVVLVRADELDLATSTELRLGLADLIRSSSAPDVVVDMSQVRFVDAACVRVILSAHEAAAARGRHLYVDGLHDVPARVFEILGLDWLRWPHSEQWVRP